MKWFVGIADCHGLESLIPEGEVNLTMLKIRAISNRHRHALVYRAYLDEETEKQVRELLNKGSYKKSLLVLKEKAQIIEVEKGFENSWELIPNDKLDPYNPVSYDEEGGD